VVVLDNLLVKKLNKMDITRYKKIIDLPSDYNLKKINTYIPVIEEYDYKRGYISRYFVQKSNDTNSTVYEIDSKTFSNLSSNSFYITITLNWRITGTQEQIKESNFKSVKLASQNMKSILTYLPNYLQFYKY
jgi:hypothetical protein